MAKQLLLPALALVARAVAMELDATDPLYPCVETLGRQRPANCEKHRITLPSRPGGRQLVSEFAIREGENRLVQAVFRVPFVNEVKLLRLKGTSYDLMGFAKRRRDGFLHYQNCHNAGTYLWEVYKAADADFDPQDDDTDDDDEPMAWMIRASMMETCERNPTLDPFYVSKSSQQVPPPKTPSAVSSEFGSTTDSELPDPVSQVMAEDGPVVPARVPGTTRVYGSEKGITPVRPSAGSGNSKTPGRLPPSTGSVGSFDTFDDMDPPAADGALGDSGTDDDQMDEFGLLPSPSPESNPPVEVNARVVALMQAEITATGSVMPSLPTPSPMPPSGMVDLQDNVVVVNPPPEVPMAVVTGSTMVDDMPPMPTQKPSLPPGMSLMDLPDNIEIGTPPADTPTSVMPAATMVDVMPLDGAGAAAPPTIVPAKAMPTDTMPSTKPMGDATASSTLDMLSAVDKLVQDLAGDSSEAALLKQVAADAATIIADMESKLMAATIPGANPMPSTAHDMMPVPTTMPADHAVVPPGIIVGTEPLAPQAIDNNPFGTAPGPVQNLLPGEGLLMDMAENPPLPTLVPTEPTTTMMAHDDMPDTMAAPKPMMAHDDMPDTMAAPKPTDALMPSAQPVATDAPIAAAAVNLEVPEPTSEFYAPIVTDSEMKSLPIPPVPVTVTDMMNPTEPLPPTAVAPVMSDNTPMPMTTAEMSSAPPSTVTATVTEVISESDTGPEVGNPDSEYPEDLLPIDSMTENEFLRHLMDYIKTGRLDIALVKIQSRLLLLPAVAANMTTTESKKMADDEMNGPDEVITNVKGINESLLMAHEVNETTPAPVATTNTVASQPSSRAAEPVMEAKAQTGDMKNESNGKANTMYIVLGVVGAVCAVAMLMGGAFGYRRYREQRQPKYPIMRINNLPTHKVDVSVDDLWKQQQMGGDGSHGERLGRLSGTATVV